VSPPSYKTLVNGFLQDVADASGATDNVYGTDTQYTDTTGPIAYSSSFGGTWTDNSTALPTSCLGQYGSGWSHLSSCVTIANEQAEIQHAMTVNGWTGSATKMFLIFTPKDTGSCESTNAGAACAYTEYCAFHSDFTDSHGAHVIWGNHPHPLPTDNGTACDSGESPNGDPAADDAVNLISHEHNEAITDPFPNSGWLDSSGAENGDKCVWDFGTPQGSTGSGTYNQTIGAHHYYLQQEWSNIGSTCRLDAPAPAPPPAALSGFSPGSGRVGDAVTLTGTSLLGATAVKFNGTADPTFAAGDVSVTAHVPAGATTGKVTVTTPSGTLTSATSFSVLPTIAEPFSPAEGPVGTVLTLSGATFAGTTAVKVGGVPASYTVQSATTLKLTAPSGAVSGPVAVTNAGGTTTTSGTFTVDPKIAGLGSSSGSVGSVVKLGGSGFGALGETRVVRLNGTIASSVTWSSPTLISFVVPPGATTGTVSVQVGSAPVATSSSVFRVVPKVTGFDIAWGRAGDAVTIQGGTLDGATAVTFNGVAQPIFTVALDGSSIATTIPAGATTGRVSVRVPSGTFTSPANLAFRATEDEPFAPSHGVTGTVLLLSGKTFGGTSRVTIGGVQASYSVKSQTSLQVTVPSGAVSGPIAVTNGGGTTTTAGSFTVDPKISGLSSSSRPAGATVTIGGSGFGASGEARTVLVNGVASPSVTWSSPTRLSFVVPAGAGSGHVTVQVGSGLVASSPGVFTVTG
jgi:hypothetical protein